VVAAKGISSHSIKSSTGEGSYRFSPSFCKLLGYTEDELMGKLYDEITVPGTNHIPITWQVFVKTGFLFGI
jgi:hypothetical protein